MSCSVMMSSCSLYHSISFKAGDLHEKHHHKYTYKQKLTCTYTKPTCTCTPTPKFTHPSYALLVFFSTDVFYLTKIYVDASHSMAPQPQHFCTGWDQPGGWPGWLAAWCLGFDTLGTGHQLPCDADHFTGVMDRLGQLSVATDWGNFSLLPGHCLCSFSQSPSQLAHTQSTGHIEDSMSSFTQKCTMGGRVPTYRYCIFFFSILHQQDHHNKKQLSSN